MSRRGQQTAKKLAPRHMSHDHPAIGALREALADLDLQLARWTALRDDRQRKVDELLAEQRGLQLALERVEREEAADAAGSGGG
jgi:hypothetical protein